MPPPRSRSPEVVAGYGPLAPIASGALARVVVARKLAGPRAGEAVALKLVHPHLAATPEARAMTLHERDVLATLDHPGIARLLGLVDEPPILALELAWVRGPSLALVLDAAARRTSPAPLAWSVVCRVVADLLDALAATHAAGWVHRDVNPRNLVLGEDGRAVLVDFGLASRAGESARGAIGTAAYTAPEALGTAPVAPASDVFAAGVVLWEALRLERLFRGASEADTLLRVAELPVIAVDTGRPDLTPLRVVTASLLSRDPAARPTADEAKRALEPFAAERDAVAAMAHATWAAPEV